MGHFSKPMDDLLLQTFTMQHWLEVEDDDKTFNMLRLATIVLVIGSNKDHAPGWGTDNATSSVEQPSCRTHASIHHGLVHTQATMIVPSP